MAIFGQRLRITAEPEELRPNIVRAALQPAEVDGDMGRRGRGAINLDNILKLIPADIVSIYLTARGIGTVGTPGLPLVQAHWPGIVFWTCLATCIVVRVIACKPAGQAGLFTGVNWSLVVVTALAFFIWAHAVSDIAPVIPGFSGGYAGFFAMIFGVLAPKLVRAE